MEAFLLSMDRGINPCVFGRFDLGVLVQPHLKFVVCLFVCLSDRPLQLEHLKADEDSMLHQQWEAILLHKMLKQVALIMIVISWFVWYSGLCTWLSQ